MQHGSLNTADALKRERKREAQYVSNLLNHIQLISDKI